jgi:hypothetical protein
MKMGNLKEKKLKKGDRQRQRKRERVRAKNVKMKKWWNPHHSFQYTKSFELTI